MSASASEALKGRRRSDYAFFLSYRTRWSDNDQYAHLNNSIYYHLFDSVINAYLITHCAVTPPDGDLIGLVVSSFCHFYKPLSFPAVLDLGLRVNNIGKSSVAYEVGVFERQESMSAEDESPGAVGGYTHVFVNNKTRKSTEMTAKIKQGLQRLHQSKAKL